MRGRVSGVVATAVHSPAIAWRSAQPEERIWPQFARETDAGNSLMLYMTPTRTAFEGIQLRDDLAQELESSIATALDNQQPAKKNPPFTVSSA